MSPQQTSKSFKMSPSELSDFHSRGYYGPFKVYEPEEMRSVWNRERRKLMDRSQAVFADSISFAGNTNIANYDRHLDSAFLAQHICMPEIVDRVTSVLGPDVLCWRTEFFPKHPGDEGTDWHQADTFANASGSPQIVWPDEQKEFGGTITVWTAFTETNQESACLQFIPGTHRTMFYDETKGMHYDPEAINQVKKDGVNRGFYGYDYRRLQINPEWSPDESKSVPMIMRPGEAILFWSTLMHASYPHTGKSPEMRLGFAARYVPTCVRVYPDTEFVEEYGGRVSLEKYGAVLVAGTNRFSYNRIATETTRGFKFISR